MKWVSYAWTVLVGLITFAIAVILLMKFSSHFERTVVDLLVMIYLMIDGSFVGTGLAAIERAKLEHTRFVTLMKRLGSTEFDDEDTKEVLEEQHQTLQRSTVRIYIRGTVVSLIFLAALWSLIVDLMA